MSDVKVTVPMELWVHNPNMEQGRMDHIGTIELDFEATLVSLGEVATRLHDARIEIRDELLVAYAAMQAEKE